MSFSVPPVAMCVQKVINCAVIRRLGIFISVVSCGVTDVAELGACVRN